MPNRLYHDILSRKRQHGATAIEYAMVIALIAAVVLIAAGGLGEKTFSLLEDSADRLDAANEQLEAVQQP